MSVRPADDPMLSAWSDLAPDDDPDAYVELLDRMLADGWEPCGYGHAPYRGFDVVLMRRIVAPEVTE